MDIPALSPPSISSVEMRKGVCHVDVGYSSIFVMITIMLFTRMMITEFFLFFCFG